MHSISIPTLRSTAAALLASIVLSGAVGGTLATLGGALRSGGVHPRGGASAVSGSEHVPAVAPTVGARGLRTVAALARPPARKHHARQARVAAPAPIPAAPVPTTVPVARIPQPAPAPAAKPDPAPAPKPRTVTRTEQITQAAGDTLLRKPTQTLADRVSVLSPRLGDVLQRTGDGLARTVAGVGKLLGPFLENKRPTDGSSATAP